MLSASRLVPLAVLVAVAVAVAASGPARADEVLSPYDDSTVAAPAPVIAPAPAIPPAPTYVPTPPPLVVPPPPFVLGNCPVALDPCGAALRYREVERPRYGLMIAGIIIFNVSYMPNAFAAMASNEWRLAVPVVGPFFEARHVDTSNDMGNRALVAFLVWDGLVQTAGFVMAIAGAASRHKVRIRDRAAVSFVPTGGAQGAGVAAVGRF